MNIMYITSAMPVQQSRQNAYLHNLLQEIFVFVLDLERVLLKVM